MVKVARVRELALALPEATEQDHHGRPSFRVGRIFATLWTERRLLADAWDHKAPERLLRDR
jgi:hypothetical protein